MYFVKWRNMVKIMGAALFKPVQWSSSSKSINARTVLPAGRSISVATIVLKEEVRPE